jgi:hypothetical protein
MDESARRDARDQIRDCIMRYARGIDRHDPEITLSAYHPDAVDDHGYYVGDAETFAHRAVETHAKWAAHQHYILNHLVEFEACGAIASAETYFIMVGRRRRDDGIDMSGGRYLDRFELRDGRWAIAERLCLVEWSVHPERAAEIAQVFIQGTHDRNDPSYSRPITGARTPRDIRPDYLKP